MATVADVRAVVLVLAASLHAVSSAKQCYQSSCIPNNLFACYSDQRVSLEPCNYEEFLSTAQLLSIAYLPDNDNVTSMVCVSFQVAGEMDHRTHNVVIRMCYPDQPKPCTSLEQYARHHMTEFGMHNTSIAFSCESCNADGCNSARRSAYATAALLAALTVACTLSIARE